MNKDSLHDVSRPKLFALIEGGIIPSRRLGCCEEMLKFNNDLDGRLSSFNYFYYLWLFYWGYVIDGFGLGESDETR